MTIGEDAAADWTPVDRVQKIESAGLQKKKYIKAFVNLSPIRFNFLNFSGVKN